MSIILGVDISLSQSGEVRTMIAVWTHAVRYCYYSSSTSLEFIHLYWALEAPMEQ